MFRKVTLCLICVLLQAERPWLYFRLSSWVSDHSFLLNIFLGLSLTSSFPNFSPRCVYPTGFLCVNDASTSRTSRLRKVLHSYVPKQFLTDERVRISSFDGTTWGEIEKNTFDRVRPHHQKKTFILTFRKFLTWSGTFVFEFRSLLMFRAPQTGIHLWRMTTIYSVKAGLERDEGCHSYRRSCSCKFDSQKS